MAADAWNPAMRYVETLVEHARGRPVLGSTRIDSARRGSAPSARPLRPPSCGIRRDQWCSSLLGERFGPDAGGLDAFAPHDGFYLLAWVRDLGRAFPFLRDDRSSHPYRCFYWLWKLSYLFGRRYADVLIRFEDLVERPRAVLAETFDLLGLGGADWERLGALVERPAIGRWREYAAESWFAAHEAACEETLADFLRDSSRADGLHARTVAGSVTRRWRMPRR
jgi:hypothetical protein